jgi:hypothetical protein
MTDLITAYPEVEPFKKLKAVVNLVKNIAEDMPLKLYKSYIVNRYKDKIMSKDEEFFLSFEGYHNDIKMVSQHPEYWNDFITQLKSMWGTMSNENKKVIWNYMTILTVIADNIS